MTSTRLRLILLSLSLITLIGSSLFGQKRGYQYYKNNGDVELVGKVERKDLLKKSGFWIDTIYENYQPDLTYLKRYYRHFRDMNLEVYLGTWDEDSQQLIPQLFKLLDELSFPSANISLFCLDNRPGMYLQGINGRLPDQKIFKTPTIVVNYQGKELDRIIEAPVSTLENDLVAIFDGARNYIPRYPLTYIIAKHMEAVGLTTLKLQEEVMMNTFVEISEAPHAMQELAQVYEDRQEIDKAIYVYYLNTELYPPYSESWLSLANLLIKEEMYDEAKLCLDNLMKFENIDKKLISGKLESIAPHLSPTEEIEEN